MKTTLGLLWLVLAAAGCVSVRAVTAPGGDPGRYRTFAFQPPADADQDAFARSPTGQAIRREVARALTDKGLAESAQPDFLVACYFLVEEQETAPYASPFGPLYWAAPGTSQYLRGTVVVDFVDARQHDVFWRGTARSITEHPENPDPPKVAAAVDKLMQKYPARPELQARRRQAGPRQARRE